MLTDPRLRVLQVEDAEGDAVLVREYLAEAGDGQFDLRRAKTFAEAVRLLVEYRPQVVLLDLNLPDSKGMSTIAEFCAAPPAPGEVRPPVIVLTSLDDRETAEEAVGHCAHAYLVKGEIGARSLVRAIRTTVQRHVRDEAERLRAVAEQPAASREGLELLQRAARTMPADDAAPAHLAAGQQAAEVVLTGLNRRMERLEAALNRLLAAADRRDARLDGFDRLLAGDGFLPLGPRLADMERANALLRDDVDAQGITRNRDRRAVRLLVLATLALLARSLWPALAALLWPA